jgi:formylglycine-generating enzyme required for sulfatase activity
MRRRIGIIVVAAGLASCGQKKEGTGNTGGSQRSPVREDTTAMAIDAPAAGSGAIADLEPKVPPPPPTVKPSTKGDCKTEYAPRPTRDPNPMCKIVGGTFMMGTPAGDPDAPPVEHPAHALELPAHEVSLSPYYLDQFEVTVAQIAHYLNAGGDNSCETWGDSIHGGRCFNLPAVMELTSGVYRPKAGTERLAFSSAGFLGAERYCKWAGKRLPTEAEWEFAARHDPKTGKDSRYPWGDRFEPRRANCAEETCKDGFELEAPVGSFDGTGGRLDGSSPWGVHDLAGNADEVVADCEHPYKPCDGPCRDPKVPVTPSCKPMVRTSDLSSRRLSLRSTWRMGGPGGGFRCAR